MKLAIKIGKDGLIKNVTLDGKPIINATMFWFAASQRNRLVINLVLRDNTGLAVLHNITAVMPTPATLFGFVTLDKYSDEALRRSGSLPVTTPLSPIMVADDELADGCVVYARGELNSPADKAS